MMNPLLASLQTDDWIHALRHVSVEEVLLRLLLQLTVIIVSARLFALMFRKTCVGIMMNCRGLTPTKGLRSFAVTSGLWATGSGVATILH